MLSLWPRFTITTRSLDTRRLVDNESDHSILFLVMGASFRSEEEILDLAGCDYLTISPKFLEAFASREGTVEKKCVHRNVFIIY